MSYNRQVQMSALALEELIVSAQVVAGLVAPASDVEKGAVARLNRALSSATTLLRGAAGPQSFSGQETGQHNVDPSQSQFL